MTENSAVKFNSHRLSKLIGKKITKATNLKLSNSKDTQSNDTYSSKILENISNQTLQSTFSIGKNLYIVINDILLLIQFRINGLMAINYKRSQRLLKLYLKFQGGTEVGFYNCKITTPDIPKTVKIIRELSNKDSLSETFDENLVANLLNKDKSIADLVVNQDIFPGIGNISKAEGLYRAKINPHRFGSELTKEERLNVVRQIAQYTRDWFENKKNGYKKWNLDRKVYGREVCENNTNIKIDYIGKLKRITYWCPNVQK